MTISCPGGDHAGPGPFCTRCGQRIPEPDANATDASCSEGNHQGPGLFCTLCGRRIIANPPVPSKAKTSIRKKLLIGVGGTIGLLMFIGFIGALADDSEGGQVQGEQQPAVARQDFTVDCAIRGGVIDIGDIPECIEKGEFEENSLKRVKVKGSAPTHALGKIFKIHGWDSQNRPINGVIVVDHEETYETLIRLGRGDWVNLSCYYDSFRHVEGYVEEGDVAYATVSLSSCIDLK